MAIEPVAAARVRFFSLRSPNKPKPPRFLAAALAVSLGLLIVGVADAIARDGSHWAQPLFWIGLLTLWVPCTVWIVARGTTRTERIALLVLLGTAMYVVKILYSPQYFDGFDEFLHWRTVESMLRNGRVFNANPALPVSPLYPGLEIVTDAIVKLTGLSVLVAGRLVVGVARLITILALYLLYERVGKSSWLAGVGTVVYFTNPQFLFFDASYAYESLAIPLALVVLYAVARGRSTHRDHRLAPALLVILPLAAVTATHHVTSFLLVAGLVLFAGVAVVLHSRGSRVWLWSTALCGAAFVLLWTYLVAGPVLNYLEPYVRGGVSEVIALIRGEASRRLFQTYAGQGPSPLDTAGSFAFAFIAVLALIFGVIRIYRTRRFETFTVGLALAALAYPLSGLFHFTTLGAPVGQRLPAFLFVGVAFCIAVGAAAREPRGLTTPWRAAFVLTGAVLLYGGIATGGPSWLRLPGPYLVSADSRSIETEGISAASWAGKHLPRNSRIGADRINEVLMLTYGHQWPVTALQDKINLAPVFLSRQLTPFDLGLLHAGSVHYLVVDYRLTRGLPRERFYYSTGEPLHRTPIPVAAFAKFDQADGVSRIFDSGNIVIYDVSGLARHG